MVSIGIDVSKGKSTVCILSSEGEMLKEPFEMLHTVEDLDKLANQILNYAYECRVIMEVTGHYHWPVLYSLLQKGIFVSVVNPYVMSRFSSQSIRKSKTDKIDSMKIARYGIVNWSTLHLCTGRPDVYAKLNLASRQYYHYTCLLVETKNGLGNLLDQTMPGINSIIQNDKLLEFTQRYLHFDNIVAKTEESFVSDYTEWAKGKGYRNNKSKAVEIYALANSAIPVRPNTEFIKTLVLEAVRVQREVDKTRNIILARMEELANSLPEYQIIASMPGIGPILASRIIAEIGDVQRFHSRGALIAFAGIDAPPFQSVAFTATKRTISKRGNKYLRKTGYEIMMSLMIHKSVESPVYQYIQKKRAEGKHTYCAYFAGFNKFLRIYYGKVNELYRNISNELVVDSSNLTPVTKEAGNNLTNQIQAS